jgi:hypothetical protein
LNAEATAEYKFGYDRDDFVPVKDREENSTNYARQMTKPKREYLFSIFEGEIARLENLPGWNCSAWKV